MAENTLAELKPWIEQQKAHHLRKVVQAAKRGVERMEKLWDGNEPDDARFESFAAAALDRHDNIVRRNLGMNDADTPHANVAVNIAILSA
jgi:hypothetical protein